MLVAEAFCRWMGRFFDPAKQWSHVAFVKQYQSATVPLAEWWKTVRIRKKQCKNTLFTFYYHIVIYTRHFTCNPNFWKHCFWELSKAKNVGQHLFNNIVLCFQSLLNSLKLANNFVTVWKIPNFHLKMWWSGSIKLWDEIKYWIKVIQNCSFLTVIE